MRITKDTTTEDIAISLFAHGLEKNDAPAVLAFVLDPENEGRWYRPSPRGVTVADAVAGLRHKREHDARLAAAAPERAAKVILDQAWRGIGALARAEAARRDRLAISQSHRDDNRSLRDKLTSDFARDVATGRYPRDD